MRNHTLAFVLALAGASLFAQQPDVAANRERPRMSRSLNYGNWVGKQVMNPEFMEKVGIQSEQAQKLKEEMEKIDARLKTLDERSIRPRSNRRTSQKFWLNLANQRKNS